MKTPKLTESAKYVLYNGWPKLSSKGIEMVLRQCKKNGNNRIDSVAVVNAIEQLGL